jgi:uncharacterized protein YjbI with pentapeptide repeats
MSEAVTVEIKSIAGHTLFATDVSASVDVFLRLKAALEVAIKAGANLAGANLAGADLAGANLAGANLADAYLADACLAGADLADAYLARSNLAGANLARSNLAGADLADACLADACLAGAKIKYLAARSTRSDGYEFFGWCTDGEILISAGCRLMTPGQYRAHIAGGYPGTDKAVETTAILDFIERRAAEISASKLSEAAQ